MMRLIMPEPIPIDIAQRKFLGSSVCLANQIENVGIAKKPSQPNPEIYREINGTPIEIPNIKNHAPIVTLPKNITAPLMMLDRAINNVITPAKNKD